MIAFFRNSNALVMALAIALSLATSLGRATAVQPNPALEVSVEPEVIVNGSPCLFRVKSQRPLKALEGKWLGHEVFFNFNSNDGAWYGFAGAGVDETVGPSQLTLDATPTNSARFSYHYPVKISRANYRTSRLGVPSQFTEPDPDTLARIKEEQAIKKEVFARITPSKLWSGKFVAPTNSVFTNEFGIRRTFNRKVQSTHQGLDMRASVGTPVSAMNNGVVILARPMFFEGGFIVIDHGQGLLSLYMHLSELKVKEGDTVKTRQIIGLSGGTGRATAPHLHIGVRWQGVYVDPAVLLTLPLP
jgi:murein DD-endopeptidase MepM/ murein hydrolase activator NlpD